MRDPSEVIAALHSEWESLNLRDAYAVSVFLARVMAWLRALTPPAGAAPEQGEEP